MSRYEGRINARGTTSRERNINRIKYDIMNKIFRNPSYKNNAVVTDTYGEERQCGLVINSGTQEYYKEFEALPDTPIYAGDYVEWGRGIWLVHTCSTDDEIYKRGSLWQCNWKMKWQNDKGDIIERWCFASSASKYNEGVEQDKIFTLGSDQCKVYMPIDEEVLAVTKKQEMCFIIDNATKGQPRVYEAHNPSNVYLTFDVLREDDGKLHGCTDWILKETTYTLTEKDLEYGVCGYKEPEESSDEPIDYEITGATTLPLTKYKTYTVDISEWDENYDWNTQSQFKVIYEKDGNSIKIRVDDPNAIGSFVRIDVLNDGNIIATRSVEIKGLYG